ncbi:CASP-like protein 4D1 [Humulus lupulus]|uniref:CASP-like protein 4D1 n=1 Tax=Humulus lupulus TaxID=3486 RepID=UPI002B409D3A|nr:CASP-like protein 4D1 [Humulus lupulus]
MAKSAASKIASLVLRILTIVLLLISLVVLSTNSKTVETDLGVAQIRFKDILAYRYVLFTIVIGVAYSLLQLVFTIFEVIRSSEGNLVFDFYGDKIISYVLATGAGSGFGVTNDMKQLYELGNFFEKSYASISLLFLGFICTAVLSVLSSYALPKPV